MSAFQAQVDKNNLFPTQVTQTSTLPAAATKQKVLYKIAFAASAIFITIGAIALIGTLLPHTSFGNTLLHSLTNEGLRALTITPFILSLISFAVGVICLPHNQQKNGVNSDITHQSNLQSETRSSRIDPSPNNSHFPNSCWANTAINHEKGHSNEDSYVAGTLACAGYSFEVFGVYDGHGGPEVSQLIKDKIIQVLQDDLNNHTAEVTSYKKEMLNGEYVFSPKNSPFTVALSETYLKLDLDAATTPKCGSCAATVIVDGDKLYLANVGDTRVVLGTNSSEYQLTDDDKVSIPAVAKKVKERGLIILNGRIISSSHQAMEVASSIGDHDMGKINDGTKVIPAEPKLHRIDLGSCLVSGKNFLIIASDGLWDKVSNKDAVSLVRKLLDEGIDQQQIVNRLIQKAIDLGSNDDITIMIVDLNKAAKNTSGKM